MSTSSDTSPQHPPFIDEQIRLRDAIAAMSPAERTTRCARVVLRSQLDGRAPTEGEVQLFVSSGDYASAIEDPVTFERLRSLALKAARPVLAATWEAVGRLLGVTAFDPVPHAILQTILKHETEN